MKRLRTKPTQYFRKREAHNNEERSEAENTNKKEQMKPINPWSTMKEKVRLKRLATMTAARAGATISLQNQKRDSAFSILENMYRQEQKRSSIFKTSILKAAPIEPYILTKKIVEGTKMSSITNSIFMLSEVQPYASWS